MLPPGVVCDRCNAFASALDGDLRGFLHSTFFRTDTTAGLSRANAVVSIDGTWWATRLNDRTWRRWLPSQCVVHADGRVHGVADNEQSMLEMRAELARAREVKRRDSDDRLAATGQPIIVHAADREFHLLATDTDEPQARAQIATVASQTWSFRPDLQQRLDRDGAPIRAVLSMNVEHANRALVKAAFNFLAIELGPDIARLPLFAHIRRIVPGGEGAPGCMIDGAALRQFAGLGAGASDAEAVGAGIFDRELGESAESLGRDFLQPDVHTIVLGSGRLGMFVFISLRGRPVARIQLLPKLPGFNVNGLCATWIARPGKPPQRAPTEQLDALRNVLRAWALKLPAEPIATDASYVRSKPQPFVIQATYAPGAGTV
ncbi:MAG: hypothetical protein JWP01_3437 [Myxococcales bacterium]|nr:hypothetical protein [Myxococcales bacterium]